MPAPVRTVPPTSPARPPAPRASGPRPSGPARPHARTALLALLSLPLLTGCGKRVLRMDPVSPPWVEVEARLADVPPADTVLVVPPVDGRDDFLERLPAMADAFESRGLTLVVPTADTAEVLDDRAAAERAQAAGAGIVLRMESWRWLPSDESEYGRRWFAEMPGRDTLAEVDRAGYEAADGRVRYWYGNRVLDARAVVVDAASARSLGRVSLLVPRVRVADPLVTVFATDGEIRSESYAWAGNPLLRRQLADRAARAAFRRLAELLTGG